MRPLITYYWLVFARQFWYLILRQVGLHSLAPEPNDLCFDEWVFIPLRLQNEETKRI
jgi:hypothetical protein